MTKREKKEFHSVIRFEIGVDGWRVLADDFFCFVNFTKASKRVI